MPPNVIVKWVERTPNLDDIESVWNTLTDMGVDNPAKKRWITLYSQDLLGKTTDELKEKLELVHSARCRYHKPMLQLSELDTQRRTCKWRVIQTKGKRHWPVNFNKIP